MTRADLVFAMSTGHALTWRTFLPGVFQLLSGRAQQLSTLTYSSHCFDNTWTGPGTPAVRSRGPKTDNETTHVFAPFFFLFFSSVQRALFHVSKNSSLTNGTHSSDRSIHSEIDFFCPPVSRPLRAAASLFAVVKAGEGALKRARSASGSGGAAGGGGGAVDDASSQPSLAQVDAKYLLSALDRMDSVFGIFYEPAGYGADKNADGGGGNGESAEEGGGMPEIMTELLAKRLAARESKDWATADAVRDEIKALGYAVKV